MGKVINLNNFKKSYDDKLVSDMKNKSENTSIIITKDEMEICEKDLFFDDDDFISKFYSKEM